MDPFHFLSEGPVEAEFIPLLPESEDEADEKGDGFPEELPILPLRNTVLLPGVVIPITVGRDKSTRLIRDHYKSKGTIGVVAQKDSKKDDPQWDDLERVGTAARIIKQLKMPDGNFTVIIQGKQRIRLISESQSDPYMVARVERHADIHEEREADEFKALIDSVKELAIQIIHHSPNLPSEASLAIKNIENPGFLIHFIASNMQAELRDKQAILEELSLKKRAQTLLQLLTKEFQMLELKNQIQSKVKSDIDQQQREFFLNQQLKTIQEELGQGGPEIELEELRERAEKKKWAEPTKKAFFKELEKLGRINPASPEYSVIHNYLELLLDLPWNEFTKDLFDLKRAKRILDRDHHGLDKVKKRIIEYLAVLKLKKDMKAPILCLVGPPGVGKTSLGRSIGEALKRKYVRISLGGVRDEAEIRGHRKTYIGAMPGRIIQSLKKAGSSNPVFVLDEIDKVGNDFRGDPASALLEVLDPEQNKAFVDHFVELDYDLSNVLFIATANTLNTLHPALRDRMEIIEVNGYSTEEKIEIARRHLIPRQLEAHGLKKEDLVLNKSVIREIIESYTRESGVRQLDKEMAGLCRALAAQKASDEIFDPNVTKGSLEKYLGVARFDVEEYQDGQSPGVVIGLAWTPVGGDILFIEANLYQGKGRVHLTGNLGDVMKESAAIALAFLKSRAQDYQIDPMMFDHWDVHLHVPSGAVPKDGPSAGIAMLTALASVLTQRKVKDRLAMTGEITLRGKVLPVGGVKEKILAAKRAGIKEVIMCRQNQRDLKEINPDYIRGLTFHFVDKMEEVLHLSLEKKPIKNPRKWSIPKNPGAAAGKRSI